MVKFYSFSEGLTFVSIGRSFDLDLSQPELDTNYRRVAPLGMDGAKFCTNEIKTSRFTLWNFLPLAILIQYKKVANISWTIVAIMTSFREISVNGPWIVTIAISIVLLIGITKEGITDYSRH